MNNNSDNNVDEMFMLMNINMSIMLIGKMKTQISMTIILSQTFERFIKN